VRDSRSTVIVCAYTLDRLELTKRCLRAVLAQEPRPDQIVLVADHNPELATRLAEAFPDVEVVANAGAQGLSSARNTGIDVARGDIIAFVDDDAVPEPGWLAALAAAFADDRTMAVGGHATPDWQAGQPGWFPSEYLWVVGCSYRGQRTTGRVRNPIGCNMAFRRSVFEMVGGFDTGVGRVGTLPIGAEETELCIRLARAMPDSRVAIVPDADVRHYVPSSRGTVAYFVRRCFYEGVSKAVLHRLADDAALAPEGDYVLRTLTRGTFDRLGRVIRLDRPAGALASIAALWAGLAFATGGFGYGRLRSRGQLATPPAPVAPRRADGQGMSGT